MYEEIASILKEKKIVHFLMHGLKASFHINEDDDIVFTVDENGIICYAPDVESAIECLTDECEEDELEITD